MTCYSIYHLTEEGRKGYETLVKEFYPNYPSLQRDLDRGAPFEVHCTTEDDNHLVLVRARELGFTTQRLTLANPV